MTKEQRKVYDILRKVKSANKKRCSLPFDIQWWQVIAHERCPLTDLIINYLSTHYTKSDSPSIHVKDRAKGYVPGNVQIISRSAKIELVKEYTRKSYIHKDQEKTEGPNPLQQYRKNLRSQEAYAKNKEKLLKERKKKRATMRMVAMGREMLEERGLEFTPEAAIAEFKRQVYNEKKKLYMRRIRAEKRAQSAHSKA